MFVTLLREITKLEQSRDTLSTKNAALRLRIRNLRMINANPEVIEGLESVASDVDAQVADMTETITGARAAMA